LASTIYRKIGKRTLDIFLAGLGILLLWPVLLLVAAVVRVSLGRPVLFRQRRPGLNSRIFEIIKFRTMAEKRDAEGNYLPDEYRQTRVGRILRTTSLDELPELWNVLRGEMSIVGPRPLLPEYLVMYNAEQARRHDIRPGITGLAQVEGRNSLSWEEKLRLDVWYVDNYSLALDLRLICRTVWKVLSAADVNETGSATTRKFSDQGNPDSK
jgi:sugar transferase EpsL